VFDLRRVSDQMDGWYGFGTHAADYERCAIILSQKIGVKQLERTDPILRIGCISFLTKKFFRSKSLFTTQNMFHIIIKTRKNRPTEMS